jgi:hypothetical protein
MSETPENQQQYGSILTILGENAEQNGKLQNKQITFTHIAIGDANDTYIQPDRKQTALTNELARIPVNSVDVLQPTPESVPMLKVEAVLPDDVNDLVIREFAAVATFDGNTYFHAVGNCARIYVPAPVNNGNVSTPVTLEMIFVITSADPIVEIDPNVVTASREYVNNAVPKFAYSTFGTHLRSSQDRFKDAINIKDFGATGNFEDDTDAFLLAAEFVKTNGKYKTIYAPADSYRCDKPIVLWDGASLIGDGRNSTSITNTDPTSKTDIETLSPVRQLERNVNCNVALFSSSQGYSYNSQVKDLRLSGPVGSMSDGSGKLSYSIYTPEITHMELQGLLLDNAKHGFWSYNTWMCSLEEVVARNVFGWGFAVADDGNGKGGSTSTHLKRCWVNTGAGGYYLYGMNYSDMVNCGADHIGLTGYDEMETSPYFFHLCNGLNASGCGSEDVITDLVYNVVSGHVNLSNPTIQNWRPNRDSLFKALIKNTGANLTVMEGQTSLLKVSRNDPGELYSVAAVSEGSRTQVIGGFCDRAVDEQLVTLASVFHGGGFEALGNRIKLRDGFGSKQLDYGLLSLLQGSWSSGSGDGVFTKSQVVNCKAGDLIDVPVSADVYKIRDAFARLVTDDDESRQIRVEVTHIYHSPEEYNRVRVWFFNPDGSTNYQLHDIVISSIISVK